MKRMWKRRGIALGSVMLLVAAFTVVALAVASAVTFSLQVSSRLENQQIALELADSALQQALAELSYNPDYGRQKERCQVSGLAGMDPTARGLVTFDPDEGQPFCTNNRSGDRPLGWDSRSVPKSRVHLVASGSCRGVQRRVEMMVYSPRFPRAIACDGPVELSQSLVAAVTDLNAAEDLDPSELGRGDVLSNETQLLRRGTRVKGSAQALLSVTQQDDAVVEGEVLAPFERTSIPLLDVALYDPRNDPDVVYESRPSGLLGTLSLTGITRFEEGPLTVQGDLKLDNAVVYVAGDLRVTGSLQGVGALFVAGQTEIGKAVRLSARDNLALICKGDLRLRGDGKSSSFFQGLLSTQGSLSADQLTVVGAVMAQQRMWISNCNILYAQPGVIEASFRPTQIAIDRDDAQGTRGETVQPKDFLATRVNGFSVRQALEGGYRWLKPGVLDIEKREGQFHYTFRYVHSAGHLARIGPTTDRDYLLREAARLTANEWRRQQSYLVNPARLARYIADFQVSLGREIDYAIQYQAAYEDGHGIGNFNLSPNRFLSEVERLRVLYRLEL